MAAADGGAQRELDADSTAIQYDMESPDAVRRIAHVTITPEHVESARQKVAKKIAAEIRLPGFRKGKVPVKVVRSKFPGDVEREALDELIPAAYRRVIDAEEHLHPIAEPRVENFQMDEGQPVRFDLVIEVRPDLSIDGYKGLSLTKEIVKITDDRVQQALEELAQRNAQWVEVKRGAKPGDAMRIAYVPLSEDGTPNESERNESYSLTLGADGVLPEFNSALEGLEAGDDTEVEVSYPPDYPREDLRGQTMRFAVEVKEVKEKQIPTLDDAFAAERTAAATLEELRTQIRSELEKSAEREAEHGLHAAIVDKLLASNDVPVPQSLEARYLQAMSKDYQQMTGSEMDENQRKAFVERFRPQAEQASRRMILLDNLRRLENIEVSDEDVLARIKELAEERGVDPAEYERAVRASDNMDRLRSDLEEQKIFERICAEATIEVVEKEPSPEDESSAIAEG